MSSYAKARVSAEFLKQWRDVCAKAQREQTDVIHDYLREALRHAKRPGKVSWPPDSVATSEATAQLYLSDDLSEYLRTAAFVSGIRASRWLRLAMWTAVQACAKPIRKERAA